MDDENAFEVINIKSFYCANNRNPQVSLTSYKDLITTLIMKSFKKTFAKVTKTILSMKFRGWYQYTFYNSFKYMNIEKRQDIADKRWYIMFTILIKECQKSLYLQYIFRFCLPIIFNGYQRFQYAAGRPWSS